MALPKCVSGKRIAASTLDAPLQPMLMLHGHGICSADPTGSEGQMQRTLAVHQCRIARRDAAGGVVHEATMGCSRGRADCPAVSSCGSLCQVGSAATTLKHMRMSVAPMQASSVSKGQNGQHSRTSAGTTARAGAHAGGASATASPAGGARTAAAPRCLHHIQPDEL